MDPRQLLGVGPNATDEEIRAAYLAKVKENPPERSPEAFEAIRDAYNGLRDKRSRIQERFFSALPDPPLVSLLDGMERSARFVGPEPWLEVLKGK
jgi:DnaJ domain